MNCKKHSTDLSSSVGVCASCLRERLLEIIAAQVRAQLRRQAQQDCRKSDAAPQKETSRPSLPCPRSVSPNGINPRRFHATPLVGPTGLTTLEKEKEKDKKSGTAGKFSSVFMGVFRSKSDGAGLDPGPISDRGVPVESCAASHSWFSNIIPRRRKKQIRNLSLHEDGIRGRGMSPSTFSDAEGDEHFGVGSSGYSSESSQNWKHTPRSTPAVQRSKGRKAAAQSRNVSGMAFCLSPLVRPGPNRNWIQKVAQPEMMAAGEGRVVQKPHLSTAASFGKNRSRKFADFGKQSCNLYLNY